MMFLILGLALIFALGLVITFVIRLDCGILERLAWAYGLGLAVCTLLMFYMSAIGVALSSLSIFGEMSVITLLLLTILYRRGIFQHLDIEVKAMLARIANVPIKELFQFSKTNIISSVLNSLLVAVLLSLILGSIVITLYWPPHDSDEIIHYDNWGRAIWAARTLNIEPVPQSPFWGKYPLLTGLAHAYIYFLGGSNPKFLYPLFYISLLLCFYYSVRDYCSVVASLVYTLILATIPSIVHLSILAYTDLPNAYFIGMGTIVLYRWMTGAQPGYLPLSGLLLSFGSWTRPGSEALFAASLLVLVLYSWQRKRYLTPLWFALLFLCIRYPWHVYATRVLRATTVGPYPVSLADLLSPNELSSIIGVASGWVEIFSDTSAHWASRGFGPAWSLFLITALLSGREAGRQKYLYLFIMAYVCALVLGSYIIGTLIAGDRIATFLFPILLFSSATSEVVRRAFNKLVPITQHAVLV